MITTSTRTHRTRTRTLRKGNFGMKCKKGISLYFLDFLRSLKNCDKREKSGGPHETLLLAECVPRVAGCPSLPFTLKFRSALTRLDGADAVVLQSNCVRSTSSRSLHSNCLGRGSNPYCPRYKPSALTNRPSCHTWLRQTPSYVLWIDDGDTAVATSKQVPSGRVCVSTERSFGLKRTNDAAEDPIVRSTRP